ncbi:MAG: hypothetical protein AAB421_03790 [Patescibacteria group bacterium]
MSFFRNLQKTPPFLWMAAVVFLTPIPVSAAGIGETIAGWISSAGSAGLDWIINPVMAKLAEVLIALIGYLLFYSASLFNLLIQFTVVDFGGTLATFGIDKGIDLVWSAFRDLANITIIGMFVFVSISIILGLQAYGQKKFVAHILVVAVLINFSLLFTKLTIDVSNIAARQFYAGLITAVPAQQASIPAGVTATNTKPDVAGAFLYRSGLTGGFDTYRQLSDIGAQNAGGITGMLVYAVSIATFMLALSVSFLYGSFLLASRAILLVFLLVTSSLALGAYLIPKFKEHKFGWKGWLDALIRGALLGPLLMLFLWASLHILAQSSPANSNGTLGAFFQNPADEKNWVALLLFVFTAGMLYLSIKASSMFSGSIVGMNLASKIPGAAMVGGAMAGAWLGRNTVGRGASMTAQGFRNLAARQREAGNTGRSNATDFFARRMQSIAKKDFNAMRTGLGKEIAGVAGLKGKMATGGSQTGGIEAILAAKAKGAKDKEEKLSLSEDQLKAVRAEATSAAAGTTNYQAANMQKEAFEQQKQILKQQVDVLKTAHQENMTAIKDMTGQQATDMKKTMDTQVTQMRTAEENIVRADTQIKKHQEVMDAEIKKQVDARSSGVNSAYVDSAIHEKTSDIQKAIVQRGAVERALGNTWAPDLKQEIRKLMTEKDKEGSRILNSLGGMLKDHQTSQPTPVVAAPTAQQLAARPLPPQQPPAQTT